MLTEARGPTSVQAPHLLENVTSQGHPNDCGPPGQSGEPKASPLALEPLAAPGGSVGPNRRRRSWTSLTEQASFLHAERAFQCKHVLMPTCPAG